MPSDAPSAPSLRAERSFYSSAPWTALLLTLVCAYAAAYSATSILGYRNFGMSAYDIGIHAQAVWKLASGRGVFNTIRGMNVWGDHCWFIFLLMAPVHWLAPRLETLLVVQTVALGAAALPLAQFAFRRSGSRIIATLLAVAWLLSPALQNMNLENFHPEVVAAAFLMWAIERADARRWYGYAAAVWLALLCKEDVALTVFFVGFWVALRRDRRMGLATMAVSVAWFLLCMKALLPLFNEQGFFRFSDGYWFSDFWREKFSPAFYQKAAWSVRAQQYYFRLGAPVLFLAVLDPLLLLIALPGLAVNLLSRNDYLISIDYHYNYQTLPAIFAATASALGTIAGSARWRRWLAIGVTCMVIAASARANARWSQMPLMKARTRLREQWQYFRTSGTDQRFQRLASHLPADPDVPIAVSHNLVPNVAQRDAIYMFPNPWQTHYWGIRGENPGSPAEVQALFLDRVAAGDDVNIVADRLIRGGEFRVAAREGTLLVALRVASAEEAAALRRSQITGDAIRVQVFRDRGEQTELAATVGDPDTVLSTLAVDIPETHGNLKSTDAQDLGVADNAQVRLAGEWRARGRWPVRFRARADDGCRVYVDDQLALDHAGVHAFGEVKESAPLRLRAGAHLISVDYFEWGGAAGLRVEWTGPDGKWKVLEAGDTLP